MASPVLKVPSSVSAVTGVRTAVKGITVTDANEPHAGLCAVDFNSNSGTLSVTAGALTVNTPTYLQIKDTFANCQASMASLGYLGAKAGSDTITVTFYDQIGANTKANIAVIVSGTAPPPPPPTAWQGAVVMGGGATVAAAAVDAAAPPPAGLVAADITSTGMTLSWTQQSPVPVAYVLQYRVTGTSTWINTTPWCSYVVAGLASGTSYDFQLVAITPAGASTTSGPITTQTVP